MLRHVVLLTLKDEATEEQLRAFLDGLAELPGRIPSIRAYSFGPDRRLSTDTGDVAVVADFDDDAGYRSYATHPAHLHLIAEVLRPILQTRTAVQYQL